MTEDSVNQRAQISQKEDKTSKTVGEFSQNHFPNTVMAKKSWNPLINNVIYDSGCEYPLIHDKSRFRDEIVPVPEGENKRVHTPDGEMQVVGHEAMVVKGSLHGQIKEIFCYGT